MHYCLFGSTKYLIKKVCWQSVLTESVSGVTEMVGVASFLKTLKKEKKQLFHRDDAVCLQMVAKGIISMNVTDRTKVGTDKITRKDVAVTCPRAKRCVDGDECWCPGFMADELWEELNLSS